MVKAGVLHKVPAVHAHPIIDGKISIERLGAVLVVVLAGVKVLLVGFVHPGLDGALTEGALAAGPRARGPLDGTFSSVVTSEGGDGDEAGILEGTSGPNEEKKQNKEKGWSRRAVAPGAAFYHFFSRGLGVGFEQDSSAVSRVLQLQLLLRRHAQEDQQQACEQRPSPTSTAARVRVCFTSWHVILTEQQEEGQGQQQSQPTQRPQRHRAVLGHADPVPALADPHRDRLDPAAALQILDVHVHFVDSPGKLFGLLQQSCRAWWSKVWFIF